MLTSLTFLLQHHALGKYLSWGGIRTSFRQHLTLPRCSFSSSNLLLSFYFSFLFPLLLFCCILWESGWPASPALLLAACEISLPLAGAGSPWGVTEMGEAHGTLQIRVQKPLLDGKFLRTTEIQVYYCVVAGSLVVTNFSTSFSWVKSQWGLTVPVEV